MGKDSGGAPDYGPLAAATELGAELSRETAIEQLQWAKDQDKTNRALLDTVLGPQLTAMDDQLKNAQEDREYYEGVYQPLEVDLAQDAVDYASDERIELEAGRASADVAQAFEGQREQQLRSLEGYGIDPSQTRSQALDFGIRAQQAAGQASASNQARTQTENVGRALRGDAINTGRGLASNVAGAYGQAVQAGQVGLRGALDTTRTSVAANAGGVSALNAGANYTNSWGNALQGQQAQYESNQSNSPLAGIGTLAGAFMGGPGGAAAGKAIGSLFAEGGEVPDTGRPALAGTTDSEPAMLTPGEYVITADAVRAKGTDFFDKMNEKYAQIEADRPPQGADGTTLAANGGYIRSSALPMPSPQMLAEGGGVTPNAQREGAIAGQYNPWRPGGRPEELGPYGGALRGSPIGGTDNNIADPLAAYNEMLAKRAIRDANPQQSSIDEYREKVAAIEAGNQGWWDARDADRAEADRLEAEFLAAKRQAELDAIARGGTGGTGGDGGGGGASGGDGTGGAGDGSGGEGGTAGAEGPDGSGVGGEGETGTSGDAW